VDHDFAATMIPHHQGAIEMAQAELRCGRNEQLRRIAQEIIVEQQQEIAAIRGLPELRRTTRIAATVLLWLLSKGLKDDFKKPRR
jgi:hypothetical protein